MNTTTIRCEDVRDDIDAFPLGVLERDEARRVYAHVAGCADCRRLLDEANATAAALALSVPVASAGPALKARVMAAASATGVSAPARRHSQSRWWLAAAAVLVAALAGVSAWGVVTQRRLDRLQHQGAAVRAPATPQPGDLATAQAALATASASNTRLEATLTLQHTMADVMAQPDAQHVTLHGTAAAAAASAQYVWSPARSAGVIMAAGLAPLDATQTYQAWAVYATTWESAGTFSVDSSGAAMMLVSPSQNDTARGSPSWYCVTVEPAGGSPNHTGPLVLSSQ